MKILGINLDCEIDDIENFDGFEINNAVSLLDYDSVVISTEHLAKKYNSSENFSGLRRLTTDASRQIIADYTRIQRELTELLNLGKRIYIFTKKNPDCYVHTGQLNTSGTGKNTKRTNIVKTLGAFDFLPIELNFSFSEGENILVSPNTPYSNFLKKLMPNFYYAGYFNDEIGNPIATIKNTNRVISAEIPYGEGKIIFLPAPKGEEWSGDLEESNKVMKEIILDIFDLEEKLNQSTDFTLPEWANSFQLPTENEKLVSLKELQEKQEQIILEIEEQENKIKELEEYKQLFTATGTPLENIVRKTLKNLGFTFEEAENNRSDLIANFNEQPFVIEVKGVCGSAAEKNAVQLEKWATEYFLKYECHAKQILIINAYRETPLSERKEPVFPNQMLGYAKNAGHCLITGIQLLCMYLDIEANPAKKEEILAELFATVGIYPKYTDFENYLTLTNEETN